MGSVTVAGRDGARVRYHNLVLRCRKHGKKMILRNANEVC